jgi:hypothetical protein
MAAACGPVIHGRVGRAPEPNTITWPRGRAPRSAAVLSAVASTAGDLTNALGAVQAVSRGFGAAAVLALAIAGVAFWRMPAVRIAAGSAGMHMH